MRSIAALTFLTLDGVMQGPGHADEDREGGFDRGGWAQPYWEDVMNQVMREAMAEPYDMLLGRKTYDSFAGYWPHQAEDHPVARIVNSATKVVVTSRPEDLSWTPVVPVVGDVIGEVARLKEQEGPLLQIHGSGQLVRTLLAHELIDELRLWTFPVTVGGGRRLFEPGGPPDSWSLVKSEACSNSTMMTHYRRSVPGLSLS